MAHCGAQLVSCWCQDPQRKMLTISRRVWGGTTHNKVVDSLNWLLHVLAIICTIDSSDCWRILESLDDKANWSVYFCLLWLSLSLAVPRIQQQILFYQMNILTISRHLSALAPLSRAVAPQTRAGDILPSYDALSMASAPFQGDRKNVLKTYTSK